MSGTKSRNKGKDGERQAVLFLKELGFADARRRMQSQGWAAAEVECIESLPNVHFEIKYGYDSRIRPGGDVHRNACAQAFADSNGKEWCVLWRETGCRIWKLTYASANGIGHSTVAGEDVIRQTLLWLNTANI